MPYRRPSPFPLGVSLRENVRKHPRRERHEEEEEEEVRGEGTGHWASRARDAERRNSHYHMKHFT